MLSRLRGRVGSALDRRFQATNERVEAVGREVDAMAVRLELIEQQLRWVGLDHASNRRRLRELRAQPAYAATFDDPTPLISVVIPTYQNTELLLTRSLPSVLAQTYERLEVIVVGDVVAPEAAARIRAVDDPRVRFINLAYRFPESDPYGQWMVASVTPRNAGHELAAGTWFVDFDDDDALRPRAIEDGLGLARAERLEFVYGPFDQHWPDGRVETFATFPPVFGRMTSVGAVVHGGLGFFERTVAAATFGTTNDWFRTEAMMRAGVRFGMQEEIVVDYYPSMRGLR